MTLKCEPQLIGISITKLKKYKNQSGTDKIISLQLLYSPLGKKRTLIFENDFYLILEYGNKQEQLAFFCF